MRFSRKKNINTSSNSASSNSDLDIDESNSSDSECNEDTIDEILQELVIEEERNVGDAEESSQFNLINGMNLATKIIFFFGQADRQTISLDNYGNIHMMYLLCLLMMK